MNKKFSTLVAVLLAAGVFSTVDAKVVTISKGAMPTVGSSFAIGTGLNTASLSYLNVETVKGKAASTSWSSTAAPNSVTFEAATKWKFIQVNGANADGGYYLQAQGGAEDGLYLSAEAKLVTIEAAVIVDINSTNIRQKASTEKILTIDNGSVTWGAGSNLELFSDGTTKVELSLLSADVNYAIVVGDNATWDNASNTFVAVASYTPAGADTYTLEKVNQSSAITDKTKDIWEVEAVNAEDAAKGFYLKTTQGYISNTGTPLSVVADKAGAQAFTYTADGELAAVGETNELDFASTLGLVDASGSHPIDIAFWQAEAETQPTLPGVDDVKVDDKGAVIVDESTEAIATPIYLKVGDEYLKVNGDKVEATATAPTAATAEAYSWTMEGGAYTSVALSNKDVKACNLVSSLTKAADAWALAETGTVFTFAPAGPDNIQLVNANGVQLGAVSNILSVLRTSAAEDVGGQKLVTSIDANSYYLLSAGESGKFVSKKKDEGLKAVAETNTDDVLWKVIETAVEGGKSYQYQFVNKAGEYLNLGDAVFTNTEAGTKYTNGFVLINKAGTAVKSNSGVPDVSGAGTAATWGLYEAAPKAYTAAELNKFEGAGFSLTIDTKKDAKATIKGADMFAGKLMAVETGTGTSLGVNTTYQLKTADGKFVVLTGETWGSNDLNGGPNYYRGFKFKAVETVTGYSNFRISHAAGSDSKDLIVEVLQNDKSTVFGRLYIADVNKEYLLTTTLGKADKEVYPYVVAGNGNAITLKALVEGGRFVNISYVNSKKVTGEGGNLDRFGKVYTVGLNDDGKTMEVGYAKLGTEVLASSPETQWAISGKDGEIIFANREQPTVKTEALALYATATPDVYSIEKVNTTESGVTFRDTIRLTYVENTKKFDGFMFAKENQLRNQRYNLSAVNKINEVTQQMYWAENTGTHKIGLDGDSENASKWKLSFDKKDLVVDDVTTKDALIDTVLVISNVSIIKDNKVVTVPDTLAILPYIFQNAANSEYVKFNDKSMEDGKFYICDKDKVEANATRFALKMRPDSTYHFVTLNTERNSNNTKVEKYANPFTNKLYGDRINNWLGNASNYSVAKGNDLMAVTPIDVPEYRQVAFGDTIRIYREENDSQVMYEKRDASVLVEGQAPSFLNIDNVNQFTKINPAIFVDTAYVNREAGENTCYQYLLAVNVEEKTDAICPLNPEHNTQAWRDEHNNGKPCPDAVKSHYLKGRFLINLMDTANVYEAKQLHSKNPYIDRNEAGEVLAKLAFVEGYHLNDTLFIQRGNGEYVKLRLDDANFNIAKFAFHYDNYAEGTFKIQTQHKNWKDGDLDVEDDVNNDGYLKWINGTVVVAQDYKAGDVFNLNEDETRIPTANEGINASEVSVIAKEGAVVINGAAGKKVTISNVLGQTIANTVLSSDNATLSAPAGIVVVAVEGEAAVKAIVK